MLHDRYSGMITAAVVHALPSGELCPLDLRGRCATNLSSLVVFYEVVVSKCTYNSVDEREHREQACCGDNESDMGTFGQLAPGRHGYYLSITLTMLRTGMKWLIPFLFIDIQSVTDR
jgi:hypothetical protein